MLGMNPVLLINDDKGLMLEMKNILNELKIEFVAAGTAARAMSLATDHDFSLAIIDLKLADMDGDELYEKLLKRESHYDLPVGILLNTMDKEELDVINRWVPNLPVTLLSVPLAKEVFRGFVEKHAGSAVA